MVYTTYLWWFGGWFIIVLPTLLSLYLYSFSTCALQIPMLVKMPGVEWHDVERRIKAASSNSTARISLGEPQGHVSPWAMTPRTMTFYSFALWVVGAWRSARVSTFRPLNAWHYVTKQTWFLTSWCQFFQLVLGGQEHALGVTLLQERCSPRTGLGL